jgi:hypothetical protein
VEEFDVQPPSYISERGCAGSSIMASGLPSTQDLSSILAQVKGLEEEKIKLLQLLETERERLKETQAKADKMSEGKRIEMRQALDTVITNWLQDAVKDEKVRDEFKQGMNRLVETTAEDSGVWQVVCCASSVHAQKMQEIERIRLENEELKSKSTGEFRDEASRKRGRDEQDPAAGNDGNVWAEFENEIRSGRTFGTGL